MGAGYAKKKKKLNEIGIINIQETGFAVKRIALSFCKE